MDFNIKTKKITDYDSKKKLEESKLYYVINTKEYLLWANICVLLMVFIPVYYTQKLNKIDYFTVSFSLIIIFILIFALLVKNIYIMDIIHVCNILILGFFSFVIKNYYLLIGFLVIIFFTLFIWMINNNECPMGRFETLPFIKMCFEDYNAGYILYVMLIIIIIRLCYMIYKKSF